MEFINHLHFVHLHNHSEHSLLDGVGNVNEWIIRAKELGMKELAITEHGNLNSAQQFIFACKQNHIKPIIGVEFYIVKDRLIKQKEYRNHITILAKNTKGYHNLIKLTSTANIDGFYNKPRIDFELLKKYKEGLIVLSGCYAGVLCQAALNNNKNEAIKEIRKYREVFGRDYYIEIMLFPYNKFKKIYTKVIKAAKQECINIALTNDCHYINKQDSLLQDILLLIKQKKTFKESSFKFSLKCLWLKSVGEIMEVWEKGYKDVLPKKELIRAIGNTVEIADKVEEYIIDKKNKYPCVYSKGKKIEGSEINRLLLTELKVGWKKRKIKKEFKKEYFKRLRYELKIITDKGMSAYFLILADVIHWAESKDILVGFGRGSAAGSLLAYLLGIHHVNPIKHGLLFERFINKSSDNMPDIDVDFDARYKEEVKQYLIDKYGQDKVGEIVTYGIMKLKMAIKDIARVYGFDYHYINELTKQLGNNCDNLPEYKLKKIIGGTKIKEKILRLALRVRGQVRHLSIHPAGLVVTPENLTNYLPLQRYKDKILTGWTEGISRREISALGLVKYDILGLKTLSVISDCIIEIKKRNKLKIKLISIPLNDKEVYKNYRENLVMGIFQCESNTMQGLIKHLKPKEFEDIVALLALDRPAPLSMGIFEKYLDNRKNKNIYKNFHSTVWEILKGTYGLLLYQEQVINLTKTLGKLNEMERLIVKKILKKPPTGKLERKVFMEKQNKVGKKFIENACNEIGMENAKKMWEDIKLFGLYSFNRSHSLSYALLTNATMWLKTHFKLEFYMGCLNHTTNEKAILFQREMKRQGVEFLFVDINKSKENFIIEHNNIRCGFSFLKGVGKAAKVITVGQPFYTIIHFLKYVKENKAILNKRVISALIKAGALDCFGNRGEILHKYNQKFDRKYIGKCEKINYYQQQAGELSVYGFYSGRGLLEKVKKVIEIEKNCISLEDALKKKSKEVVKFYAKIERVFVSKKAIFINISSMNIESVIVGFMGYIEKYKNILKEGDYIICKAIRNNYKERKGFLIDISFKIKTIELN